MDLVFLLRHCSSSRPNGLANQWTAFSCFALFTASMIEINVKVLTQPLCNILEVAVVFEKPQLSEGDVLSHWNNAALGHRSFEQWTDCRDRPNSVL
jgi:hypothetical protein